MQKTKSNKSRVRKSCVRKSKSIKQRSNKSRVNKSRVNKSKYLRRGGSLDDELMEKMERGESGFLQKPKKLIFLPGTPLLDKFYARKTDKDKRLDAFHQRMRLDEQAHLADLASRDRYLRDPRINALDQRESYFRRPELVDYNIDKKSGEVKQTFKATRGLDIGLNEEKDGPPNETDWGFYSVDFRGGKRRNYKKK